MPDTKLETLNNTFRSNAFHMENGKFVGDFSFMAGQVADELKKIGLKEGTDFTIGQGRGGAIAIDPAALPDPSKARDADFSVAPSVVRGNAKILSESMGVPGHVETRYSGNANQPFAQNIVFDTNTASDAAALSDILVKVRREARIPKADLTILYGDRESHFALSAAQLSPEKLRSLQEAFKKEDIDHPGRTYQQQMAAIIKASPLQRTQEPVAERGLMEQVQEWQKAHHFMPTANWGDLSTPNVQTSELTGMRFSDGNYVLPTKLKDAALAYGNDMLEESRQTGINLAKTAEFKDADLDGNGKISAEEVAATVLARQMRTEITRTATGAQVVSQVDFKNVSQLRMDDPAISGGSQATAREKAVILAREILGDNFAPTRATEEASHDDIFRAQLGGIKAPPQNGGPKR